MQNTTNVLKYSQKHICISPDHTGCWLHYSIDIHIYTHTVILYDNLEVLELDTVKIYLHVWLFICTTWCLVSVLWVQRTTQYDIIGLIGLIAGVVYSLS